MTERSASSWVRTLSAMSNLRDQCSILEEELSSHGIPNSYKERGVQGNQRTPVEILSKLQTVERALLDLRDDLVVEALRSGVSEKELRNILRLTAERVRQIRKRDTITLRHVHRPEPTFDHCAFSHVEQERLEVSEFACLLISLLNRHKMHGARNEMLTSEAVAIKTLTVPLGSLTPEAAQTMSVALTGDQIDTPIWSLVGWEHAESELPGKKVVMFHLLCPTSPTTPS